MQQTETYKLNKPEMSDPFSAAPLNENADKLEGALSTLTARITAIEAKRIVFGSYYGYGQRTAQVIDLGEKPLAIMVCNAMYSYMDAVFVVKEGMGYVAEGDGLILTDTGISVRNDLNKTGKKYNFMAIFGDWPLMELPKRES